MASMDARERIIAGAVEVFSERGIAGTSIADIIERSGGPRGSLYHYFPEGKAQLAQESTLAAGRVMGAVITRVSAEMGPRAALDKIVEYFRRRLLNSDYDAGCPVAAGALAGNESPAATLAAGEAFAMWRTTLANSLWQTGLSADESEDLAVMAIASIEGALIMCQAQKSTDPLDRVRRVLTSQIATN